MGSLILTSHFHVIEKFTSEVFSKFYNLFILQIVFLLKYIYDLNYELNDSQ